VTWPNGDRVRIRIYEGDAGLPGGGPAFDEDGPIPRGTPVLDEQGHLRCVIEVWHRSTAARAEATRRRLLAQIRDEVLPSIGAHDVQPTPTVD
jgi:hypothetical protein